MTNQTIWNDRNWSPQLMQVTDSRRQLQRTVPWATQHQNNLGLSCQPLKVLRNSNPTTWHQILNTRITRPRMVISSPKPWYSSVSFIKIHFIHGKIDPKTFLWPQNANLELALQLESIHGQSLTCPTLCRALRSSSDLSYCLVSSFSCSRTEYEQLEVIEQSGIKNIQWYFE